MRGVDGGVLDRALELGGVDEAELVRAGGGVFEVRGEERGGQIVLDVVEEGLLRLRLYGVEGRKGQADQAVGVGVGDEGGGRAGGQFDGLGRHGRAADVDGVGADDARCAGRVAVLDAPGGVLELGVGGGFGGVVERVGGLLGLGEEGGEEPEVGGAGVEV